MSEDSTQYVLAVVDPAIFKALWGAIPPEGRFVDPDVPHLHFLFPGMDHTVLVVERVAAGIAEQAHPAVTATKDFTGRFLK